LGGKNASGFRRVDHPKSRNPEICNPKSVIQNQQAPRFISGTLVRGTISNLKAQLPKFLTFDLALINDKKFLILLTESASPSILLEGGST